MATPLRICWKVGYLFIGLLWAAHLAFAQPVQGVYRGAAPGGAPNTDAYSTWLGKNITLGQDFLPSDTWANITGPNWMLSSWQTWVQAQPGRNLLLAVPMLPSGSGYSLESCASGTYDAYWATLATNLVNHGLGSAYLRLGWEFDGRWYAWKAPQGSGLEASYAGCFRSIVDAMRNAQPQAAWQFVWNTATSFSSTTYLANTWPGSSYVDVIGVDLYDQSWAAGSYPYPATCDSSCQQQCQASAWNSNVRYLNMIRDFAQNQQKPMSIPEWGATLRSDGHGGGDDPYYIQNMHDFIANPVNNVAFHSYFDYDARDGTHRLSSSTTAFPSSAALFQQLY